MLLQGGKTLSFAKKYLFLRWIFLPLGKSWSILLSQAGVSGFLLFYDLHFFVLLFQITFSERRLAKIFFELLRSFYAAFT